MFGGYGLVGLGVVEAVGFNVKRCVERGVRYGWLGRRLISQGEVVGGGGFFVRGVEVGGGVEEGLE